MDNQKNKKDEKKPLLDKLYEKAKDDPILIPLTWRIWIAIAIGLYAFVGLVLFPIHTCLTVDQKVFPEDVAFIGVGFLVSGILFFASYRAIKKERGKNWLRWFKR
ncbi:MAG: hypothetical protein P9L90_05415 [Candidatus Aadella gelida]|nr:hypothetical protein [Candidatus Aadella gelida]